MSAHPDFKPALVTFVKDECFKEGANILTDKDISRKNFNINTFRQFSYKEQLGKVTIFKNVTLTNSLI